jgi:hypothetical protein
MYSFVASRVFAASSSTEQKALPVAERERCNALTMLRFAGAGPTNTQDNPPGHDRPDPQVVPEEETPEDTEAIEKEKEKIKQRKVRHLVQDRSLSYPARRQRLQRIHVKDMCAPQHLRLLTRDVGRMACRRKLAPLTRAFSPAIASARRVLLRRSELASQSIVGRCTHAMCDDPRCRLRV